MTRNIEIVQKHLPGDWTGDVWLVKDTDTDEHFVVSGTDAAFTGWEVLVFPADAEGEVTNWIEVAGGRGISHEDAIAELGEVVQ